VQSLIKLIIKRPKFVFAALVLVSLAAATQLGKLNIVVDTAGLMKVGDPELTFDQLTQETFGSNNIVVVYVEDKALFTTVKLTALAEVNRKLEELDAVAHVNSLFSLEHYERVGERLEVRPLIGETLPQTAVQLDALRQAALHNPFARNLLASDGSAMLFEIHVRGGVRAADLELQLLQEIEQAIAPLRRTAISFSSEAKPFERVFLSGPPYLRQQLDDAITTGQGTLVVLVLLLLVLYLLIRLRSLSGLLVPLVIAGLSSLWTLGFMAAVGLPISLLSAIVPVLIAVFGALMGSVLLDCYQQGERSRAGTKSAALLAMAAKVGLGMSLSFAALYLSFLLLILHPIEILRQFGLVASAGLLFSFILAWSLTPLYLLTFGGLPVGPEQQRRSLLEHAADALLLVLNAKKHTVLLLSALLCLIAGSGVFWIKLNNEPRAFFATSSPVHTRSDIIAERIHGTQTFAIVFSAENDGAFQDPQLLNEVKKVQDFIRQMKLFDSTLSLVDQVALLNRALHDGDEQYYRIPPATELEQILRSVLNRGGISAYASAHFGQTLIRVWHQHPNSHELDRALTRLQEFTNTLDRRLSVRISGESVLLNTAAHSLVAGLTKSLLGLLGILLVLVSVLFLSIKAGLIVLIPNLIIVFALFGLLGYFAIPLNIGTVMAPIVVLGIAVSYTLRLMLHYNDEVGQGGNSKQAMERALRAELPPIISATLAFLLGFSVLLAASLKPVSYFGGLSALLLLLALLANLFITPQLLTSMRFVTLWRMMTVTVGRKTLDDCELFRGMHAWQIKQIILLSQVQQVKAGDVFIRQGDIGHEMFVILEGTARVEKAAIEGGEEAQVLNYPHEGEVIGELALISQQERLASVVAETDLVLLVLEWRTLERLGRFLPMISARLFLNIARIIGQRFARE